MNRFLTFSLVVFIALGLNSCVDFSNTFEKLPPGKWRASLQLDLAPKQLAAQKEEYVEVEKLNSAAELPFNFDLQYDAQQNIVISIHNGDERIEVKDIIFGRDRESGKDTFRIDFPLYQSYIEGFYEESTMEGNWVVTTKENYRIPFIAKHGVGHRFVDKKMAADADLSGKWEVKFEVDTEDEYPAIAEFKQTGSKLEGTFLTETGDYRYLEGIVQKNKFWLSTFDGSHAFLFEGKILEDKSIIGTFRSGKHYTSNWVATKNDNVQLGDPYTLTYTTDDQPLAFNFTNVNGEPFDINQEKYEGKAKLIQILGTWCPNCKDETNFLVEFYKNKPDNLEIIGVAFEKYKTQSEAAPVLDLYKDKMNVPYDIVYGGYYNKKEASAAFPNLNKIISYPTLIYLNKDNEVVHIHTGFSGPATSKYAEFKQSFAKKIEGLTQS